MGSEGLTLRLEPFTRAELHKIHGATVHVLERAGVRVLDPEAVTMLQAAGGTYDEAERVVKIPEGVLRELLLRAPSRFHLYSRDSKHVLSFGEGNTYFSSMRTAVWIEDGNGVRPPSLRDVENFYRLVDASPDLDHASWVVWPRDVPNEAAHIYEVLYGFKYSTKTLDGYNWSRRYSQDTVDMAAIVAGGPEELTKRPMLLGFAPPVSPLTLARETMEGLIVYARGGQPCIMPPEGLAGTTAPSTLAGVLVQQNAEVLASIAVAQCARRGAPVLYGSVSTVMNTRSGSVDLGGPEVGLISLGAAQLARYYGLPSCGTGGNTDAPALDHQAGAESATTLLLSALAGFDIIYDVTGSLESSLSASYAKLILDSDLAGAAKRITSGIEVSEETLATEVIEAAGPKGSYPFHPHTIDHFRRTPLLPDTFLRSGRASAGSLALAESAQARAETILAGHIVDPPLQPATETKLNAFLKKALKRPAPAASVAA